MSGEGRRRGRRAAIATHRQVLGALGERALGEAIPLLPYAKWRQSQWPAWSAIGLLSLVVVFLVRELRRGDIEPPEVVVLLILPALVAAAGLAALFAGWASQVHSLVWDPEGLKVRFFGRTVRLRPGDEIEVRRPLGLEGFVRRIGGRGWVPLPGWVFDIVARRVD